jgi:hypothetical protein
METKEYWKSKEEALDRTLWRTRFGRGYGPVVRTRLRVEDDYRRRSLWRILVWLICTHVSERSDALIFSVECSESEVGRKKDAI